MVGYERDMRAIRRPLLEFVRAICLEGLEGVELGWDYYDPILILEGLEIWSQARAKEGWTNASPQSFDSYWEYIVKKSQEQSDID
jgi:hypothetical protein